MDQRLPFVRVLHKMPTAVGGRDVSDPNLPPAYATSSDITVEEQQPVAATRLTNPNDRVHAGEVESDAQGRATHRGALSV